MSNTTESQATEQTSAQEANTLDEIVDALVAGKAIRLPLEAGIFALTGDDARLILQFYAGHRDLWPQQKQLSAKEVDDLLSALESPKPSPKPSRPARPPATKSCWRIIKLNAHRFAGLHRHCDANGQPPERLMVELGRDVTCVSGFNGAGKTAFQSAVMWCLTGHAMRSQHRPDEVHEPMSVEVHSDDAIAESASTRTLSIPPVVPLPSAMDLAILNDRPALDTWVQLSLRDQTGREVQVKRSLVANSSGTVNVQLEGFDQLGLSKLAIEAGTLMPAIGATMRFDEKTTFAAAIAQLTGLKPLEDLGRRAVRIEKRLSGDEATRVVGEKSETLARFASSKRALVEAWEANAEALGSPPDLLTPDKQEPTKSCADAIASAKEHLERVRDAGQADVVAILGTAPTLNTKEEIAGFVQLLDDAKEQLGKAAIGSLPSINLAKTIGSISATDREAVRDLLSTLRDRAVAHVERLKNRAEAARWQLYAMVGQWHKQHHAGETLGKCPVCASNLERVPPDALLDKSVAEALQLSMEADADAAKSLLDWERDAARELMEALKGGMRSLADRSPPASLLDIYQSAFVKEPLAAPEFANQLKPLRRNAQKVWELAVTAHPLPPPL